MPTIEDIQDQGSIIMVKLAGQWVYFDHRMFDHFSSAYDGDFRGIEFETDGQAVWESDEQFERLGDSESG